MFAALIICAVSFLASGLTLFSGFGLGTLLLPAFAVFFGPELAVAMTAVVHLANNLFKLALLGKHADKGVVLRFGVPAILAALAGALALNALAGLAPLFSYAAFGQVHEADAVKLVIGTAMIVFALLELRPEKEELAFPLKYLPWGGLISGFFGGLSGHQGALRSAFLIRCGLSKEAFVSTGVVIACLIDFTRLSVYAVHFSKDPWRSHAGMMAAATLSAFAGVVVGTGLLSKVTLRSVQRVVAVMLVLIGALMAAGLI